MELQEVVVKYLSTSLFSLIHSGKLMWLLLPFILLKADYGCVLSCSVLHVVHLLVEVLVFAKRERKELDGLMLYS